MISLQIMRKHNSLGNQNSNKKPVIAKIIKNTEVCKYFCTNDKIVMTNTKIITLIME